MDGFYRFVHFEFHWGLNDSVGSEHAIYGVKFPLEVSQFTLLKMNDFILTKSINCISAANSAPALGLNLGTGQCFIQ